MTGSVIAVDGGISFLHCEGTMDFEISPAIENLRKGIASFVEANILPLEADPTAYDPHGNIRTDLLDQIRAKAKAEAFGPCNSTAHTNRISVVWAWRSATRGNEPFDLRPGCLNSAAPDDGNMMLLDAVATPAQKERWLRPIEDGLVRSAFAMTEPHPGGGSDPSMMRTFAEKVGDKFVVRVASGSLRALRMLAISF